MSSDKTAFRQKSVIMWIAVLLIGILFGVLTKTHDYYAIGYNFILNLSITYFGYILVGIVLGMPCCLTESIKAGPWRINWTLILGFFIPIVILYIAAILNILNIGVLINSSLGTQFTLVLGLITGYTVVLSLYKN